MLRKVGMLELVSSRCWRGVQWTSPSSTARWGRHLPTVASNPTHPNAV